MRNHAPRRARTTKVSFTLCKQASAFVIYPRRRMAGGGEMNNGSEIDCLPLGVGHTKSGGWNDCEGGFDDFM